MIQQKFHQATYLPKNETGNTYPVKNTALLVIDPVNDFLSVGGAGWDLTKTTVEKNDVIKNLKRLITGARAKGITVFFGPMAYTEEDYVNEHLQKRSGINRLMFERKMFIAGSWGADFHPELQPDENDIVLLPHKSCDVFKTDLPEQLKTLNITHLVLAGMTANLCCESTGRSAMEAGFDVTFISDAIGAASLPEYEVAIHVNYPLISNAVIKVDEFLNAINNSPDSISSPAVGDKVVGSDNGEIGTIERIVESSNSTEGYFLVPRGLIFKTDTYIPFDAVTKRIGNEVHINVPKIIVAAMPWSEVPTKKDRKEKEGPKFNEVSKLYGEHTPTRSSLNNTGNQRNEQ